MKKFSIVLFLLVFSALVLFAQSGDQEEVDYLLFLPNSGDGFVNEEQARIQLDKTARYLKGRDLVPGQVIVYGYAAYSLVDVDPMDISKQRALFVINELQKRGISRDLFADPVAHGSVYLWGSNTTEENREPNRRVRILIDGTLITPEVIAAPNIADTMLDDKFLIDDTDSTLVTELSPPIKEPKPSVKKEKSDIDFPWWILLPLLLIPLLFLLLKSRKKEEKPKPEPTPQRVEPTVAPTPAAAPIPEPQPVVQQAAAPEPVVHTPEPEPVAPAPIPEPEPMIPAVVATPVVAAPIAPHIETYEDVVDLEEEIRRRAYFHSQGHDYCDMDGDWFVAIPRVRVEFEEKGYETYMDNGTWWAKKTIVKKI